MLLNMLLKVAFKVQWGLTPGLSVAGSLVSFSSLNAPSPLQGAASGSPFVRRALLSLGSSCSPFRGTLPLHSLPRQSFSVMALANILNYYISLPTYLGSASLAKLEAPLVQGPCLSCPWGFSSTSHSAWHRMGSRTHQARVMRKGSAPLLDTTALLLLLLEACLSPALCTCGVHCPVPPVLCLAPFLVRASGPLIKVLPYCLASLEWCLPLTALFTFFTGHP